MKQQTRQGKPCKTYASPQLALQLGRLNCRAKHERTYVEHQTKAWWQTSTCMSKRCRLAQLNALHPSPHIPVRRSTQPPISSHQSMQHVTGIRPQRMAVPTVATASAAGPPRVGKTLPATEGGWWSPLGERATPCFSNQPLISQAKAKQRLRYLRRLGTSSIVSRTPKKSYQASHRPKQKRKQNKAGANEQTPSRILTTENKARVNPKIKQQCQPLIQ